MTLEVGPGGYLLSEGDGEHLWFADGLLTYKATGDQTRGMLAVAEMRAPRGSGSPSHRHEHEDEAWYVLDGHLTFWLGDHQFTATAGDFVFGPRGVEHRFRVDSEEARFLLLLSPAGFEHFTRAAGWPASSGNTAAAGSATARRPGPRRGRQRRRHHHSLDLHHLHHTRRSLLVITTYTATPGIDVITSAFPIPGFGLVPINAYVMHGPEPVLVDTGSVIESEEFLAVLRTVIDPADLRWIWLTHSDFDHIGSLQALLAENPRLRVITTFLGVGVMSLRESDPSRPGAPPQPRRELHGRTPHPDRLAAAGVRQPGHHRLPRQRVRCPLQRRLLRCAPSGRSRAGDRTER